MNSETVGGAAVLAHPQRIRSRISRWLWRRYNSLAKRLLTPLGRPLVWLGLNVRLIRFMTQAVGHLAIEPDAFVKDGLLGWRPDFRALWVVKPERDGGPERVANRRLLEYWARHIRLVRSPLLGRLLWPFVDDPVLGFDTRRYAERRGKGTTLSVRIQRAWEQRPPVLELLPEDRERGSRVLSELGLPEGAWFVCVHCREPGFSPHQADRNADILTYISAIEAIVERGGWCIRMGDPSMKPLPPLPNVVDYALHSAKSDWMDIFLCAACRCLVGTSSGLALVPTAFGVPVGMANMLPLGAALPFHPSDLGVPKLLWSEREDRLLTLKEVLDSPLSMFPLTPGWEELGLSIIDTPADEVRGLVLELLEVADGTVRYSDEDQELQRRFKEMMRPGHYSFGSAARLGRYFLRKHRDLLGDASA